MRFVAIILLLAAAGAAEAQDINTLMRTQELEVQAAQARQREVQLSNELMALENRQQADQSIRMLEAQRASGARPPVDYQALATAPVDPKSFATIPDDRLAASNARVRAAAQNRR